MAARLEGQARLNGLSGPGTGGVSVEGFTDLNGDGSAVGEVRLFTASTRSDGRFQVFTQPGCYVLRYAATGAGTIEGGYENRSFCVGSGETRQGLDTLLVTRRPAAPTLCYADSYLLKFGPGVQVTEWISPYGDEYFFYDVSGRLVARTSELPAFVTVGANSGRRWPSGYDAAAVRSVARVVDGVQSSRTVCLL